MSSGSPDGCEWGPAVPTPGKTISPNPVARPLGRAHRTPRPLRRSQERLLLVAIFALGAVLQLLTVLDAAGIVIW